MLGVLAYAYGKCGRVGAAEVILQRLLNQRQTGYVPPYFLGLACLGLADAESALRWIDLAVEERSHWALFLRLEPAFDQLRPHEQFDRLIEKVYSPQITQESVVP
jgi:hypothetical protein